MENPKRAVVFITGVTSVGKTSTARLLENRGVGKRISIGELVLKHARMRWPELTHDRLRGEPDLYAPVAVVRAAIRELCRLAEAERGSHSLILESHAVTAEVYGSRITPFSHEDLRRLAFDIIVLLECEGSTILARTRDRGMDTPSLDLLYGMIDMQRATAISYGVAVGCPVYAVNAEPSIESVASQIQALLP